MIRFFCALSSDQITLSTFLLSLALYIIAAFLQKVLITLLTFAVEGTRERVGARLVWDVSCKLHHWHFVPWQFDNEKVLCVVFKLWAHLGQYRLDVSKSLALCLLLQMSCTFVRPVGFVCLFVVVVVLFYLHEEKQMYTWIYWPAICSSVEHQIAVFWETIKMMIHNKPHAENTSLPIHRHFQ